MDRGENEGNGVQIKYNTAMNATMDTYSNLRVSQKIEVNRIDNDDQFVILAFQNCKSMRIQYIWTHPCVEGCNYKARRNIFQGFIELAASQYWC